MNTDISEFIDGPYLEYANYVLASRAIPSVCDGFKPGQRKILFTAQMHAKTRKVKTAALSGFCIADCAYHHGNTSLDGTISLMAADWKQNLPLLLGSGNFGSRLVNEPAAARYTFVSLHKNFDTYFADKDLAEYYTSEDPENPEPKYFLPLVPWVLTTGIKGIAVGHATEIQPYDIKDLQRLCIKHLSGKNIDKESLLPAYNSFKGRIYREEDNVYAEGLIKTTGLVVNILDIPPGIERETYINVLDKLEDANKIVSYTDKCTDGEFRFEVKLRRGTKLTHEQIIKLLKLTSKLNENITTIDENGKLKLFDNPIDVIKYFCDWRVKQFAVRYQHYIKRDEKKLADVLLKITFINAVNSGKITFKNRTKSELVNFMETLKYPKDSIEKLISMPTHALTKDNCIKLVEVHTELTKAIAEWKTIDHTAQYIKELK